MKAKEQHRSVTAASMESDMAKLMEAGRYICDYLGRPTGSRVARALMAKAA